MAATITKGYTFGASELVTSSKLATLVDSATISGITEADVSSIAESGLDLDGTVFAPLVVCHEDAVVCYEDEMVVYS